MTIYLDADGTPVLDMVTEIAAAKQLPLVIVKNYASQLDSDYGEVISVDISQEAADLYIVNHLHAKDLVITADRGLSALCLAKKAFVMDFQGALVTQDNIDHYLDRRYFHKKMRQQGIYSKNKKRLASDDQSFALALKQFLDAFSD